mgnify:CR=1 FL=1
MPTIDVRLVDVVKRFGDAVAVDHINLEVQKGEFFSLLGPSGCGKTTTLRMVGGFDQPTSGLIELQGEDVTWLPPYKRNVNTVFQNYALFPHLTIYENVAAGMKVSGRVKQAELRQTVERALEQAAPDRPDRQRYPLAAQVLVEAGDVRQYVLPQQVQVTVAVRRGDDVRDTVLDAEAGHFAGFFDDPGDVLAADPRRRARLAAAPAGAAPAAPSPRRFPCGSPRPGGPARPAAVCCESATWA